MHTAAPRHLIFFSRTVAIHLQWSSDSRRGHRRVNVLVALAVVGVAWWLLAAAAFPVRCPRPVALTVVIVAALLPSASLRPHIHVLSTPPASVTPHPQVVMSVLEPCAYTYVDEVDELDFPVPYFLVVAQKPLE